jgi:Flp pilus assembly protein TadG
MKNNPQIETRLPTSRDRFRRLGSALLRSQRGASLVEIGLVLPFLGLLLLGVIDFGRAYYLGIEVQSAAEAGALYGTQNLTDITGIESAATTDAPNVSGISATATNGCECSDGSNSTASASPTVNACPAPPSCAGSLSLVSYVQVSTTATYNTLFHSWLIPGLPATIALKGSAKLRQ